MTHQVWVFEFFQNRNIDELDVQKLVYRLKCPSDRDVVFKLDGYFMIDKRLEKTFEIHILAT